MEITPIAGKKAGELSHAGQRTLEVAIALAANPLLLLLDEPTSGLSPEETIRMIRLIKRLAKQRTMVVIEHNMKLVWSISTVITVLHQGQVIASGPPSEIEKNEEVRKAYLGGTAE
jgi:branched-chain amino acid transport system ATP-binding protein